MMKSSCILGLGASVCLVGGVPHRGQPAAQLYPYTIQISARSSVSGKEFQLVIRRMATSVQLRYGSLDSIRMTQLRADPDFYQPAPAGADPVAENARLLRLGAAFQKYKVFKQDSLQLKVKSHRPLVQLLDSAYVASPEVLERQEANRQRIVLDGTWVHVIRQAAGQPPQAFGAQSPRPGSHPLFYRLVHESLQAYRAAQKGPVLPQRDTNGY